GPAEGVEDVHPPTLLPAPHPELAVAVVETDGDPAGALGDELGRVRSIGENKAAEHDAGDAVVEEAAVAHAAARLHVGGHGAGDGNHRVPIAALPACGVEV